MHIGLVSFIDIDYALNLAHALNNAGEHISLYLSRGHA